MTTVELPLADSPAEPLSAPVSSKPARLHSLDVFRGMTIAFMLLVNNIDEDHAYSPLKHVDWDGWTPTDLVFPFFLFIVGVAIPFSFAKRLADPHEPRRGLVGHIWARATALIVLGELLHSMPGLWKPLPEGLIVLRSLHILAYPLVYGGIIALLIPWPWKRIANWLPLALGAFFTIFMISIFFANKRAIGLGFAQKDLGIGVYNPAMWRIPGVLVRIGICYGFAATIGLFAGWRMILVTAIILMAGYAALMLKAPFPGHVTGSISMEDNLARSIDVAVFDRYKTDETGKRVLDNRGKPIPLQVHTYSHYPDNEGLLSTIPSIATSLLGILAGMWLTSARPALEKCAGMLALGVPVTLLGFCLSSWVMPINKILWSPAFVVFTAGMALFGLGFLTWMIDVRGRRWWTLPFTIFGVNAIAAFCAQSLVPHIFGMIKLTNPADPKDKIGLLTYLVRGSITGLHHLNTWIQAHASFMPVIDTPGLTSLLGAIVVVLICWLLMSVLYVCRIFVKV